MTLLPGPVQPVEVQCACGRWLTRPDSIARRRGPICWAREHPHAARTRRRAVMATVPTLRRPPADGQLELDITTTTEGGWL